MADGTLCMSCHDPGSPATTLNDSSSATPVGRFVIGDGSNAMGSNPAPNKQISHMWGAGENNPAAGAQLPTVNRSAFDGRYGISRDTLACSRCHNPHGTDVDTTLLKLDNSSDQMCKDCHLPWATSDPDAYETHPMVADYAAVVTANPTKYKASVTNVGSGDIRLVAGGVSCTSCHGMHYTDSDATTVDGSANQAGLNTGDGKLLRTDGPTRADKSALCQACHTYKEHGGSGETMGCMVCHSGHSHNGGTPNYFVLRDQATTATFGAVSGLDYTALPGDWSDGSTLSADGYCEKCHGEVTTMPGSLRVHTEGETCSTCHQHSGATYSFEAAGGCDGCHGYPPVENVAGGNPNAGYAVNGGTDYSAVPEYKNEANTPHAAHAGGSGDYTFTCAICHLNYSHDTGTFQDVFVGGSYDSLASGSGNLTPNYDGTVTGVNDGICSNVYCHSNGGARTGDASRTYTAAAIPAWENGSNPPAITTCDACHGNTAVTMSGLNSDRHQQHVASYACNVCHLDTATDANTLAAGAIGGSHVNNVREVVFDTAYNLGSAPLTEGATPYTGATGTCSVYCHSDGNGAFKSPDWDAAASGACNICHDGKLGEGSVIATGSHTKHVSDASGPQLLCSDCHGAGADTAGHVGHLNGAKDAPAQLLCDSCHGLDGVESSPVWGNPASASCETCHGGTVQSDLDGATAPAPDKSNASVSGHNKTGGTYNVSGNTAANQTCESCHNANAAGHFDGFSGDDTRLVGGFDCGSCHGTIVTHQGKTCTTCHDPHGNSNIYMVQTASGDYSGTVAFTALTGADSYDENDAANGDDLCATCHSYGGGAVTTHNNQTNEGVAHNEGTDCFTCHSPHTDAAPFSASAGTACNDCHGNPPSTGAHVVHAIVASHDKDIEDRTDCAQCHTGADSYTYDPSADQGASLNHSNASGRVSILATTVGYNATNLDCGSACHQSSVADGAWNDGNGLNCDACHYYEVAPTSANNTSHVASLTGNHGKHFDASASCADCHTVPGDTTHITESGATDALKISGNAGASMDEATVLAAALNTGADADPGNATCDNVACHNPSGAAYSATWTVTVAGCTTCHSATDPATGSHTPHINAAGTFGIAVGCVDCHTDNTGNNAHRDASVSFTGGVTYNSVAQTCGATACHNDGNGVEVTTPAWGTASANCSICHTDPPATGEHVPHVANTTYVSGSCSECHTAETAATHIDGTKDIDAVKVTYNAVDGTCANNCHNVVDGNDWTSGTGLTCGNCHGSGKVTTPAMDRGWPPAVGAHNVHVSNASYVSANCVDCHNDNTSAHSTLNDAVTAPTAGAEVSVYNSVDGTCTNTCHGGSADFSDSIPAPVCVDCHAGTCVGTAPASGLHATTTALAHDDNFDAGKTCTDCHDSASPSAAHKTGTLQDSTQTTYNYNATNIVAYSNANGCAANCHSDGGDWNRKWIGVTDAQPLDTDLESAAVCANCHGGFSAGWNFVNEGNVSTTDHTDPDADNSGDQMNTAGHQVCTKCHGWGDATYDSGNYHQNGNLTANSDLGYDGNGSCATNCHGGLTLTVNGNSGFTDDSGAFGGLGCGSCHDDGAIPPNSGAHAAHGANADGDYSECIECHGDNGNNYADTSGTHGNGSVTFVAGITYSDSGTAGTNAQADDDTCSTSICHSGGATVTWGDASLGCSECHYQNATPTSAGNSGDSNPLSGNHGKHFDAGAVCADCHTVPGAGDTTHITYNTTLTDAASATMDEATVTAAALNTGSDADPGNASCDNAACHNPSGGAYSATWTVSVSSCTLCHSDTDPATGSHTPHVNAAGTFGIAIGCVDCHSDNSGNNAHRDGSVSYNSVTVTYNSVAQTCGATACHNDGTGAEVTTPAWGTASADCTICHADPPATGEHATHVANTTYVSGSCSECHTAETAATHIDGTKDIDAVKVTYNSVDGTCANNCHNVVDGNDWTSGTGLSCGNCHGSGKVTTPAMDRGWPPATQTAHGPHYNSTYIAANCVDCHNDNTTTHSALDDAVTSPTAGAQVSVYNSVDGTCTNTCHGGSADFTDSIPAPVCVDCHAGTYVGGGANDRTSGLHNVTPTVTGQQHDDSIAGGCASCHTSLPATHKDGTFSGGNGQTAQMGLAAFYSQTSDNNGTCLTTGCHTGRDDWSHKWDSTAGAYTTDGTACANCHGDWNNGWSSGTVHRTTAGTRTKHGTGTSYECKDCHNLEAGSGYTFAWSTNDWGGTSTHGDGNIQVNSNGTSYNSVNGTCEACHSNDGTHNFNDTAWPIALASGDAITSTCGECHDDGAIPPNSGNHAAHGANADADYTECIECHGDNGDSYATSAGTHNDGTVNFAAGITYSDNATPGTNAAADDDTCSTSICHSGGAAVSWSATSLGCSECHYQNASPTSAGNTGDSNPLSGSHGTHFGAGGVVTCADCHTVPGAGDTTHIGYNSTLTDAANATQDEADVLAAALNTGSDADPGNASCDNTACHNPSGGAYSATWTVSVSSCTLCHSDTDPATGSHTPHVNAAGTFGITVGCVDCHSDNTGNNAHRDGSVSYNSVTVTYNSVAQTCGATACHNDGTGAEVTTPAWGTASADCSICHADPPATGEHAPHVANTTYVSGSCSECHTAETASTHIDGTKNIDAVKVTYNAVDGTCTNNCHTVVDGRDWTSATSLNCTDCHGSGKSTTPAMDRGWPPSTGAHAVHVGNASYVSANCVDCHNDNTATHSTLDNAVTSVTLGAQISAYAANDCTNTCHVATNTNDWTSAARACMDCHTGSYIGGGANAPSTGLHSGTLTVSANTHDDSFDDGNLGTAACESCHTTTPSSAHIDGTFTNTSPTINFAVDVGFSDAATPTCGPNNTLATCHDDGGAWSRKWSTTATLSDGSECANCHGDFNNGFVTGMNLRHETTATDLDGQIESSHNAGYGDPGDCAMCHNYIKGDVTYYNSLTLHRDGNLQINNNAGFVDNGTTNGCNKCHTAGDNTADEGHLFDEVTSTRWTRSLEAGPPVRCDTCHGYPPDPSDGFGYQAVEGKGAHPQHVYNIAQLAAVTLDVNNDTFTGATVTAVCGVCHDNSTDTNHNTAGGARHLAIPTTYQFGASAPSYNGVVGDPSSTTPKSCSSVSCHFKATPVWE